MVGHFYESQVYDEYVIKGNSALLKCNIPSFVSDFVDIIEWTDSNGSHYLLHKNYDGTINAILVYILYNMPTILVCFF